VTKVKYLDFWRAFCADEGGATAIEYGLILAALSMLVIAAISTLGETLRTTFFEKVAEALS
jgi:pilus assembly protein Flp/PilA